MFDNETHALLLYTQIDMGFFDSNNNASIKVCAAYASRILHMKMCYRISILL